VVRKNLTKKLAKLFYKMDYRSEEEEAAMAIFKKQLKPL
jgi:hypothetical protein